MIDDDWEDIITVIQMWMNSNDQESSKEKKDSEAEIKVIKVEDKDIGQKPIQISDRPGIMNSFTFEPRPVKYWLSYYSSRNHIHLDDYERMDVRTLSYEIPENSFQNHHTYIEIDSNNGLLIIK